VKWNDGLFSEAEASKTSVSFVIKESVAESPVKKVAEPRVKDFLRKGFLNPRPPVLAPPVSPWEVKDVGVVGPPPSPCCCIVPSSVDGNGFSQSQEWPVGFYHNWEIMVWDEDDDLWDGMPLDWAVDGVHGEEFLAIRNAMEEEFYRDKMIARQKTKGKKELLNLKSSINYGDANTSSRRRKGKAHMS
jgi:hypothetical protein